MKTIEDFLSEIEKYGTGTSAIDLSAYTKAAKIIREMKETLEYYNCEKVWEDFMFTRYGRKPASLTFKKISQILNEEG